MRSVFDVTAKSTNETGDPGPMLRGRRFLNERLNKLARQLLGPLLPVATRKRLRYYLACGSELIGRDYYPALNGLDRKLLPYVGDIKGGTFIEAGANDGLSQSNTWHLERKLGWRGLLVEPVPEMAALCRSFRKAHVECSALGSFDQAGEKVTLHFGGLMTATEGADFSHMQGGDAHAHAETGASWVGGKSYRFESTINPLSTLIEKAGLTRIDLFSLDVEGFEVNVLRGIDFDRHPIRFILVETSNLEAVKEALGSRYQLVDQFSHHDYLFGIVADGAG